MDRDRDFFQSNEREKNNWSMTELLNISVDSCGDTGLNKAVFNQLFFLFHMFERRGYPRRMKWFQGQNSFLGLLFFDTTSTSIWTHAWSGG